MIIIKNQKDIAGMRIACKISAGALAYAGKNIREGMTTKELDSLVHDYIVEKKAKPSFLGYDGFPASACISINDEVIHGIPGARVLKSGDIVSVDVGAYIGGYHGDCANTFIVGNTTKKAKELIDVTTNSFYEAIKYAKVGYRLGDIGAAVDEYVKEFGFSTVKDFVGHGVGHDLHEDPSVPNFGKAGRGIRLSSGMTIAIEPMINEGTDRIRVLSNDWTVVTADSKLSAHYENTILITDGSPEILTVV
ncbi:MAG: type I methionyl aminopeptidase [Clostridia bacterium]